MNWGHILCVTSYVLCADSFKTGSVVKFKITLFILTDLPNPIRSSYTARQSAMGGRHISNIFVFTTNNY